MLITKAILHILDFNSDLPVFSQKELDLSNVTLVEYLENMSSYYENAELLFQRREL